MEIILKEDIIGLGEEGDIKKVADGYARNYLLPKGFALLKNKTNLKWLEKHQTDINKRKEEKSFQAKSLAEKLTDIVVTISAKVSSGNKLYGSIHSHQISEKLKEQNIEIDHRKIEILDPIKNVGEYTVNIKLYEGVNTKIKVNVESIDKDNADDTADKKSDSKKEEKVSTSSSSEEETKENAVVEEEASVKTEENSETQTG